MLDQRAGLRQPRFALSWFGVLLFSQVAATTSGCRPQPIDAYTIEPPAVVLVDYTWPWKQEQFVPEQGGQARWGIRSGQMTFKNNDFASQDDHPFLGTFIRGKQRGPFNMEFTLGFAATPKQVDSQNLFMVGGGGFWSPGEKRRWYLHAGGGGLYEIYSTGAYLAGYTEAGAGYRFPTRLLEWDVRAGYWQLLESGNEQNAVLLSLGLGF